MDSNLKAFLDTISFSEGTKDIGDDGYNVLFGATKENPRLFYSYADHPRIRTYETNDNFIKNGKLDFTTAAGRYQITATNYDFYKKTLKLSDFSPGSQDKIAIQLIKECHAINDVISGTFESAITKCASRWASLPNGIGDQKENKLSDLNSFYIKSGGLLTSS